MVHTVLHTLVVSIRWSLVCCAWVRSWVRAWRTSAGRRPCRDDSPYRPFPASTPGISGPGEPNCQSHPPNPPPKKNIFILVYIQKRAAKKTLLKLLRSRDTWRLNKSMWVCMRECYVYSTRARHRMWERGGGWWCTTKQFFF